MNRRRFLLATGVAAAAGTPIAALANRAVTGEPSAHEGRPLPIPRDGVIRTAFAIGPGFNVIDVSGPWEVFQDAAIAHAAATFDLLTVAETRDAVVGSGGMTVVPTATYADTPQPHVVVIPAHDASAATILWLKRVAPRADLLMSVCTGAFVLAETGLLDGKTATTHHESYDALAAQFPEIEVVRRRRFVEHDHVATAGGLTSGIDLALRVVERYLGGTSAATTAGYMEHARRSNA